ncbi:DnaJ domain containing protein [Melia azedarach]|uniref:DnaJ domain containing protein n=1 Tax=Melia azedarach TaxID=155640 RepID=A0ACC1X1H6_MELAZ|nr:DnaJ domain containing protein [Melia azedarach]
MLTNLVKLAAEKAREAAEEYYKLQNIDMAIKSLQAAKDFNPRLPNIEEYFTAYKVHELAAKKSTWYELLAITDPEVDTSIIRKHYKRLALMLHPDKNPSVAADSAFKLIQSALDVLTNPEKREAYDSQLSSKKFKTADSSWSRTRSPTTDDEKQYSRDGSHKAANASFGFEKPNPPRNYRSCHKRYRARVEINDRNGSTKIVITCNGRDEDLLRFGAKDSSFDLCYGFFFVDNPPSVIRCS